MGLWTGKMWDWTRNDEKDAIAAQDRADNHTSKAAQNQAQADSINQANGSAPVEVNSTGKGYTNLNQSGQFMALKKSVAMQAAMITDLTDTVKRQAAVQVKMAKGARKLVERIKESEAEDSNLSGFLSAGLLAAASGLVKGINSADTVQSTIALQANIAVEALIISDKVKGTTEDYLRVLALLLNAFAYYDMAVGLSSIWSPEAAAPAVVAVVTTDPVTLATYVADLRTNGNDILADAIEAAYPTIVA